MWKLLENQIGNWNCRGKQGKLVRLKKINRSLWIEVFGIFWRIDYFSDDRAKQEEIGEETNAILCNSPSKENRSYSFASKMRV